MLTDLAGYAFCSIRVLIIQVSTLIASYAQTPQDSITYADIEMLYWKSLLQVIDIMAALNLLQIADFKA